MYVFQCAGQLSIEEFYVPFGGKLDPGNRWVMLAGVIHWEPLENKYAPLFNTKTGAPANQFRMALDETCCNFKIDNWERILCDEFRENLALTAPFIGSACIYVHNNYVLILP